VDKSTRGYYTPVFLSESVLLNFYLRVVPFFRNNLQKPGTMQGSQQIQW
jgi:hypothetical protein